MHAGLGNCDDRVIPMIPINRPSIVAPAAVPPRNAYERAAALVAELQQDVIALEHGHVLEAKLAGLWSLFQECIPDSAKPPKENA